MPLAATVTAWLLCTKPSTYNIIAWAASTGSNSNHNAFATVAAFPNATRARDCRSMAGVEERTQRFALQFFVLHWRLRYRSLLFLFRLVLLHMREFAPCETACKQPHGQTAVSVPVAKPCQETQDSSEARINYMRYPLLSGARFTQESLL